MPGPFLGYLDRSVPQHTVPHRSPRDVPGPVRPPLHLPFHLNVVVPLVLRRYPSRRGADLLATHELIPRKIRCLKVPVRLGLFRGARRVRLPGPWRGYGGIGGGGGRGGKVPTVERLLEQLLLQHHRLLKIGHVRVHGVRW